MPDVISAVYSRNKQTFASGSEKCQLPALQTNFWSPIIKAFQSTLYSCSTGDKPFAWNSRIKREYSYAIQPEK